MRACIHRGAKEIGGSCVELEHDGARLVLDVGRPLTEALDAEVPLPPVQGLESGDPSLVGLVISHGHPDHYGLAAQVHPSVPLFVGEAAARILAEASFFAPTGVDLQPAGFLHDRQPLHLGPFKITPFLADHSARQAALDLWGESREDRLMTETVALARDALVDALRDSLGREGELLDPGYTATFRQNVVPAIDDETLVAIEEDLSGGDGSELAADERGRAKACAAYSSSAVAVNAFGAWRARDAEMLSIAGMTGFGPPWFERKFPTGLQGKSPNLDVVLDAGRELVAIESKCLEYLSPKEPAFRESYAERFRELASPSWLARFEELSRPAQERTHLDTAQLLKHYLGLKNGVGGADQAYERATLLYLYWEPADADDFPEFAAHRADIARFAAGLDDGEITFASLTYPELWKGWRGDGPGWLPDLLSQLDQRYTLAIAPG